MRPRVRTIVPTVLASLIALAALSAAASANGKHHSPLHRIKHIVVIYQENHSFDNLFGGWEHVDGLRRAEVDNTTQVSQTGIPYACLLQDDPQLTTPPLMGDCRDDTNPAAPFSSHFINAPFTIDNFLPNSTATRDLVHRFYQEQYQINGGNQNRYVTGSDAVGLSMGVYDTKALPIYQYLHSPGHPHYAIADHFFQSAFGGSFINHQWLIAATTPIFPGALNDGSPNDLHSVVDANGMPTSYPLYTSPLGAAAVDRAMTASCSPPAGRPTTPPYVVCGDYVVNTIQPLSQPYFPGTPVAKRLPLLTTANIGDALSDKGIDWAWYSGGWSNAAGNINEPGWTNSSSACTDPNAIAGAVFPNCPDKLFQFHHQAFNYYAKYAPGADARKQHLRDEAEFIQLADSSKSECNLKAVSFIKPIGEENEHPGYTNERAGNQHMVDLIKAIESGACKEDTLVIATYDEFGGTWDHVSPPGFGEDADDAEEGTFDQWGPGTRIPALIIAPHLQHEFVVDHVAHDTTSILTTIEHRFDLDPLGTRDAAVRDLSSVFHAR